MEEATRSCVPPDEPHCLPVEPRDCAWPDTVLTLEALATRCSGRVAFPRKALALALARASAARNQEPPQPDRRPWRAGARTPTANQTRCLAAARTRWSLPPGAEHRPRRHREALGIREALPRPLGARHPRGPSRRGRTACCSTSLPPPHQFITSDQ